MLDLLTMALLLASWPPDPCPHMIAKPVRAEVTSYHLSHCGTGVNVNVGGVNVNTQPNQCPLFTIIRPAHAESQPSANSNTYTVPVGLLAVKRLDFTCQNHWLLGIIPITVSSSCVLTRESNAGTVTHYVQLPCPVIPEPPEKIL